MGADWGEGKITQIIFVPCDFIDFFVFVKLKNSRSMFCALFGCFNLKQLLSTLRLTESSTV